MIEEVRHMDWPAELRPGTKIDVPPLHVSAQQRDRFLEGFIIYREEFEQVYDVIAAELDQRDKIRFRDSMPVYLHGPRGELPPLPHTERCSLWGVTSPPLATSVYRNRQIARSSLRCSASVA